MRKLSLPNLTCKEILISCVSNIKDEKLYRSVYENMIIFEQEENLYKTKGNQGTLNEISRHKDINEQITKDQMKFLYEKMVNKKNVKAREYYDLLLASSKRCPFCGYGMSSTLDHFLPKTDFPVHAVNPINLVPCCKDCNTTKLTKNVEDELIFIHPYFDNVDDERWLYCEVRIFPETVAFRFKVSKPFSWSKTKFERMKYHFKTFNLNTLFVTFASDEFSDNLFSLLNLDYSSNSNAAIQNLNEKFVSCDNHLINHWKTAMYDALRNSDDFIEWLKRKSEDNKITQKVGKSNT